MRHSNPHQGGDARFGGHVDYAVGIVVASQASAGERSML
jgi:hypothetical protein